MLKIEYLVDTELPSEEFAVAFVAWLEQQGMTAFGMTVQVCPECGEWMSETSGIYVCGHCGYVKEA